MSKVTVKKKPVRNVKKVHVSPFNIYLSKTNYLILGLGGLFIIIGFFIMSIDPWNSTPSLVFSPIILLIVYLIIVPLAIFYKKKNTTSESQDDNIAAGQS